MNIRAFLVATLAATLGSLPAQAESLSVMTYNLLHGQPCSGGSLGGNVDARMTLAVEGSGADCDPSSGLVAGCGLVDLAPDVLLMQEVSQVFVDQPIAENQTCMVFDALPDQAGGVPEQARERGVVEAFEHQADQIVRKLNANDALRGGAAPYKMRFVRDNPRLLPSTPDVPMPPDEQSVSDHAARLGNVEIGLAAISRYRIQNVSVHNLTAGEIPVETRAVLHATIRDDAGRAYDVYDSHLTTGGGDRPQTIAQALEIVRFISTTRRHPENPAFFTCDCNATDGTPTYQVFSGAGFVDSFAALHGKDGSASSEARRATSGRDGLALCDAAEPADRRIDYVWAIPAEDGRVATPVSSDVVMEFTNGVEGEGCLYPSDHNGVLSVFELP